MKFSMPRLITAMAVRAIDPEDLARAAREAGMPVSSATIRKAMKGLPVNMISATRIASVLRTFSVVPEMIEVISDDPARLQSSDDGNQVHPPAQYARRRHLAARQSRPGSDPKAVGRELVQEGLVDWEELARIVARIGMRLAQAEVIQANSSPLGGA